MDTLYIGNNMVIALDMLKNTASGEFADPSTVVQATIFDKAGAPVVGQQWPLTLANISDGYFAGTLESTLELLLNHTYTADVTATDPDGVVLHMECKYQATDRCVPC